ncbi:hypothetical protein CSUI_002338 [Cystoisospora suis]|uniref:Uncharacterized protein n=1 Tax=Cystoisospora suis TaxID=483139 RepID=A0A2C6L533_9APIC|nr:hypothetical protein CSUI_002338 [Cystoisospora suis]
MSGNEEGEVVAAGEEEREEDEAPLGGEEEVEEGVGEEGEGEGGGEGEGEGGGDGEGEEDEVSGDVSAEVDELAGEGGAGGHALAADGLGFDEVPDTGEVAEIVLVTTSLGSIKKQFFSSLRMRNFLDCKGVVYIIIDSNRDTSSAKNLKDVELFKEWKANGMLKAVETDENRDPEVIIPQLLVDGVVVGDETTLQDLEEDGDLDWIFSRAACPACLHEKSPSAISCESCGATFRSLIPPDYITEGCVLQMLQGCPYNEEEIEGEEKEPKERWAACQSFSGGDVDLGDFDDFGGEEGEEKKEEGEG